MPLSDRERIDWLRLSRSENVGPITFRRLLNRFGTAAQALDALPSLVRRGGRTSIRVCSADEAEQETEALGRAHGRFLGLFEPDYPQALRAIDDAPPVLAVLGNATLLNQPILGMVGSRNASLNGKRLAGRLATDLGKAGFVITSGLARGIDTAAHAGALKTGTIAVVAGGADVIYPLENKELYDEIRNHGAVISERPLGSSPLARHFPRRNRIISGLAKGVLVVEANVRSGSLITAHFAADQGREVFAVPGSPLDPRARGCNDLLRHGAVLTETADDVLEVCAAQPHFHIGTTGETVPQTPVESPRHDVALETEDARRQVAQMLSPTPVDIDDIIRNCHLPAAVVQTILLEWELAGQLERHPGNKVSRIATPSGG